MPRKLKTSTFRKTQHKKKPRKSYKKLTLKLIEEGKSLVVLKGKTTQTKKEKQHLKKMTRNQSL